MAFLARRLNSASKRNGRLPWAQAFSTAPGAITAEELKAGVEKAARHTKLMQSTISPKSLMGNLPSGVELHRPKDMTEISVLTGMPAEHQKRTVIIAPRELKTMQSGDKNQYQWQITWKNRQRWSNPLMGWTSTADPMSNIKLTFDSKEDAVAYAEKNGWKMEVRPETAVANENVPAGTNNYSQNFLSKRVLAEIKDSRDGNKPVMNFFHSKKNTSGWFMMPNWDGTADCEQHGPRVNKSA